MELNSGVALKKIAKKFFPRVNKSHPSARALVKNGLMKTSTSVKFVRNTQVVALDTNNYMAKTNSR